MNTLIQAGAQFVVRAYRRLGFAEMPDPSSDSVWETAYLCSEAPFCAETIRNSRGTP